MKLDYKILLLLIALAGFYFGLWQNSYSAGLAIAFILLSLDCIIVRIESAINKKGVEK